MRSLAAISLGVLFSLGLVWGGCGVGYTIKGTNLNQKGQIYYQYGEYDQAILAFQEGLDIDFENSATHYWLGQAYLKKADPQKAIEEFRLAVRFRPSMEIAQVALVTALHDVGQLDESIIATKSFMKYRMSQINDLVRIGHHFLSQGMEHQAIVVFERAQEVGPNNALPSMALADFYQSKGDIEGEREAIMVAAAAEPFYPGLAERAGRLGIKIESPQPLPYPRLTQMERELRAVDDK